MPYKTNNMNDQEYYDFGEWVIVDNDPKDERQVIQYDVLNDEYTLDKKGMWDYVKADRVSTTS